MTTTPHTHDDEAVDPPEPNPEYLALPKSDRAAIDKLVLDTQEMQNHVDRTVGVLGEPIFFLGGFLLGHELQIRTLKREVADLKRRISDLEDRVS